MDFITREQARRDIVSLALPQIVLDAFDEQPLPYDLDFQFRVPYQIFSLRAEEQSIYGRGRITPIWTGNGDYTIVAYHHESTRNGFFRFDIESPSSEEQPVGLTWQQVLVKEFIFLWEQAFPDEQLRSTAERFGFEYLDLLVTELSRSNRSSSEQQASYLSHLARVIG